MQKSREKCLPKSDQPWKAPKSFQNSSAYREINCLQQQIKWNQARVVILRNHILVSSLLIDWTSFDRLNTVDVQCRIR
jgi:hypothetical protein